MGLRVLRVEGLGSRDLRFIWFRVLLSSDPSFLSFEGSYQIGFQYSGLRSGGY